jgi:hypothetical protein
MPAFRARQGVARRDEPAESARETGGGAVRARATDSLPPVALARTSQSTNDMPHKHLLFRSVAREKLLRGVTALADAVRITLGPRSKSVLIAKKWGTPLVCNDGVTIAKELDLADPEEDLGARMIRQAAERTGDAVGDGTSTSTLLAHAIYTDGAVAVEPLVFLKSTSKLCGVASTKKWCTKLGLPYEAKPVVDALLSLPR